MTFGLPASVHPVVVTGGEQPTLPLAPMDGVAFALSTLASAVALRGWKKRSLGAATMFGLWFVAKPLFAATLAAGAIAIVWPLVARLSKTTRRVGLGLALLATVVVGVPMFVATKSEQSGGMTASASAVAFDKSVAADEREVNVPLEKNAELKQAPAGPQGGFATQLAHAGILDGVRPVALSMPGYTHTAYASRQLVTPSRAFTPIVYYVTDTALALLAFLWLACAGGLAWLSRERLVALRDAVRAALAPKMAGEIIEQKA